MRSRTWVFVGGMALGLTGGWLLAQQRLTYATGAGNADSISVAYGMRGIPETYFIAPDGRLIRKWNTLTAADLEQFLAELQRASAPQSS